MEQDPRRLANAPEAEQREFVIEAVMSNPTAKAVLEQAHQLDLPDWALMAGAVYQAVWNRLTGRPADYGVNDYDLAYCDPSDLSEAGEAEVIARAEEAFSGIDAEVEVCNQARVPLWFGAKYGVDRQPIHSTEDAVREFASITHSVAIRLDGDGWPELIAPYGLDELFSLCVRPVPDISTPALWNAKIARQKKLWPEIEFVEAAE
ncbi:nucleotidyltransferase family protein [Hyphobacterium sp. HN65]|uniref:Nucleotidyltransferase family protein n=1 Tax=Hyphobacterium lacteum TaxID=3116575 RepID=A0ABU7LTW2_9PROT|nr:nucleotidyltransferase family protein [Hyphobacterium sp. HN65]MEE2527338.1 nucleotidyltransferase family protein [Hyphobacterium sp. HN65]